MSMLCRAVVAACLCSGLFATTASANTSHDGWPQINGVLFMNKTDSDRPLDARPGKDPVGGTDPGYSCDEIHVFGSCQAHFVSAGGPAPAPVPGDRTGRDRTGRTTAGPMVM